jgi:hypothetical protein
MKLIQQFSAEPKQLITMILSDGSRFSIDVEYKPLQYGWFIVSLVYGDFSVSNLRIVTSPNMLYQFRNLIPFGLACFTEQNQEPTFTQDFASGRSKLYVLSAAELVVYEDILNGQVTA